MTEENLKDNEFIATEQMLLLKAEDENRKILVVLFNCITPAVLDNEVFRLSLAIIRKKKKKKKKKK
jgi:hypothetical protein